MEILAHIEDEVTKMNPSWNHKNKSRKEKLWVKDQLTWNKNGVY